MHNYCLRLSFIGTNFHGWQVQPGLRTVQGVLEKAIGELFGRSIRPTGCCRTDAGVHAKDYIANFKASKFFPPDSLLKALNALLPEDVGVSEVWLAEEKFNARYSVKGKLYVYRVYPSHARDPFWEPFLWRIPYTLELEEMKKASGLFLGRHDFSGFAKLEGEEDPFVEIEECEVVENEGIVEIRVRAKRFLRYMVRRIAGALIYLGMGKLSLEDIREFLKGKKCPYTAQAKGLTLEKVFL
jgi:tRNA pseudouridine38-40 synthase